MLFPLKGFGVCKICCKNKKSNAFTSLRLPSSALCNIPAIFVQKKLDWIAIDEAIFRSINVNGHHIVLDYILPFIRNKYFWVPLYLFLISVIWINFPRKAIYFLLSMVLCIFLSDTISSEWVKKTVKRVRPCNQEVLAQEVKLLVHCGSGYSFPSSHATNHFALALFLIVGLGKIWPRIKIPLLIWAGLISFAQVYVGVHFPVDILAGAILGSFIGWAIARMYLKMAEKMNVNLLTTEDIGPTSL